MAAIDNVIDRLIATAKAEVGYLEKATGNLNYLYDKTANAGENNYTKYGYEMHQLQPSNMDYPAAWCDCFVDWCMYKTFGLELAKKLLHGFDDYTVASSDYYKKNGQWHTSNPIRGDQIFFKNSSGICHTGLVISVANNRIYTIEGNTSGGSTVIANGGAVCEKSYPLNYNRIAGYGRPNYNIVVEEEIDMEELNRLKQQVAEINNWINEQKTEFVYNYIDDNMPEWAREAVQWEVDNGILMGTDNGLDLKYNDLRQIVREFRFFKLIQSAFKAK